MLNWKVWGQAQGDAEGLAAGLAANTTLKKLSVVGNDLGDEVAAALQKAVRGREGFKLEVYDITRGSDITKKK